MLMPRFVALAFLASVVPMLAAAQNAAPPPRETVAQTPVQPAQPAAPDAAGKPPKNLQEEIDFCKTLEDDGTRLTCYDIASGLVVPPPPAPAESADTPLPPAAPSQGRWGAAASENGKVVSAGNWLVVRTRDSMTDAERVILRMDGTTESSTGRDDPVLFFRCSRGTLEAFLSPGGAYLGFNDNYGVQYRIDDRPAVSETWGASTTNKMVFSRNPRDLLGVVRSGSKFLIEVRDFQGGRHRFAFDTVGVKDVASAVDSCAGRPAARPPTRR